MAGTEIMTWSRIQGKYILKNSKNRGNLDLDRFIPNREASDLDYGSYLVSGGITVNEILAETKKSGFASNVAYQKVLAEALNMNRTSIFSFRKPQIPNEQISEFYQLSKPKPRRIPQNPFRTLDVPDIEDDFSLNLLDWGSKDVVAIALQDTVHLWNASSQKIHGEIEIDGLVTSVGWAPDGQHIAIGLSNSDVRVYNCETFQLIRIVRGSHHGRRVGALAWNSDRILTTTGGMDHCIADNDMRMQSHIVGTYRGHRQEVCGLKWSGSGHNLASGGKDSRVFIWDRREQSEWLQKLQGHSGTVKALAWCPFQGNLLASGGGEDDRCIKFWNARTGSCLNSVDTGSQVTALLWNHHERELLSSHGFTKNQLILWDYPSMVRRAAIYGHNSRILYMCQSPDGCNVASAAAGDDQSLKFWNVFGEAPKPVQKQDHMPFAHSSYQDNKQGQLLKLLSKMLSCDYERCV